MDKEYQAPAILIEILELRSSVLNDLSIQALSGDWEDEEEE